MRPYEAPFGFAHMPCGLPYAVGGCHHPLRYGFQGCMEGVSTHPVTDSLDANRPFWADVLDKRLLICACMAHIICAGACPHADSFWRRVLFEAFRSPHSLTTFND